MMLYMLKDLLERNFCLYGRCLLLKLRCFIVYLIYFWFEVKLNLKVYNFLKIFFFYVIFIVGECEWGKIVGRGWNWLFFVRGYGFV